MTAKKAILFIIFVSTFSFVSGQYRIDSSFAFYTLNGDTIIGHHENDSIISGFVEQYQMNTVSWVEDAYRWNQSVQIMNESMKRNGIDTVEFKRNSTTYRALYQRGLYKNAKLDGEWLEIKTIFSNQVHSGSHEIIQNFYMQDTVVVRYWNQRYYFEDETPDFDSLFTYRFNRHTEKTLSGQIRVLINRMGWALAELKWDEKMHRYKITNSLDNRIFLLPKKINPDFDFWNDFVFYSYSFDDAMWTLRAELITE